jgi:hypothetical protein
LIGKDASRSLQTSFEGWISQGEKEALIEIDIQPHPDEDTFSPQGNSPKKHFTIGYNLSENGGKEPAIKPISRMKARPSTVGARGPWSTGSTGWFSCGYGPFRRIFGASAEAQRLMSSSATTRFVTMFREDASLAEVDVWLKDLNYKKLEKKSNAENTLTAVKQLLCDEFMPNEIELSSVDSDGVWLKDRRGLELSWLNMSDGYRAALALMADILRHIISTFGVTDFVERTREGKLVVNRSGVVLIDEIDAHLHPEWQREIGFWLRRHFPKIQFLIASHSPLICQAADSKGIFHLPEPGSDEKPFQLDDKDYNKIIASRPDQILISPAFGLENSRSPLAVEKRALYSRLKAKERKTGRLTPNERKEVEQLSIFAVDDEE